jgi:hypothetical protein
VHFSENGKNRPVQLDLPVQIGYNSEPLYASSTPFSTSRFNFEFRRFDFLFENAP